MSNSPVERELDDLLFGATEVRLDPDFDRWRSEHPEAVRALHTLRPAMVNQRRRAAMIRIARYSTAAAALTLSIVAVVGWLVMHQGATSAFADVIDQLRHVKNASCQVRLHAGGDETLLEMFIQGNRVRTEGSGQIRVMDFDKGRMLEVTPRSKTARILDLKDSEDQMILAGNPLDDLLKMKDVNSMQLADEPIGQIECRVYRVEEARFLGAEIPSLKLWVDHKTNLPVQLHVIIEEGMATITFAGFQWNQEFDESLLLLTLPDGYELVEEPDPDKATPKYEPSADNSADIRDGGIQEEELAQIADTLEMLGQKTEANYSAIRSWSGSYELVNQKRFDDVRLPNGKSRRAYWEVSNVLVTFSVNGTDDRIRTDYQPTAPTVHLDAKTGQVLKSSFSTSEHRWLRTPEHLIRLNVDRLRGHVEGFPRVDGFGSLGRRGRVLHREAPRSAGCTTPGTDTSTLALSMVRGCVRLGGSATFTRARFEEKGL